jgi:oligopeptide transport system ATP-binding protein
MKPLLRLADLRVHFPLRRGWFRPAGLLRAVDGVSLTLSSGEAVGLVGESGSGKSTLARAVLQLVRPTAGQVVWLGSPLERLSARELRPLRRDLQIVFQDALASLDPRMTVGEIVGEPLRVHRIDLNRSGRRAEAIAMLAQVGLSAQLANRYPHELSGGQCQRVGIARAMILRPRLLVCDEPVSALDASVQAQIVGLLLQLKREWGVTMLFVSHNLAVVRRLCDRVLVLYLGRMMELASVESLYGKPLHPYTRSLLAAVPVPDPDIQPERLKLVREGDLPSPMDPPSGCVFRTRCPHVIERCKHEIPSWDAAAPGHHVACHRWRELSGSGL